jgi:Putative MetA-pathway of phenol degradation
VGEGGRRIDRVEFLASLIGLAGSLALLSEARAGSARDYLNAPVDSWLAVYNAGYTSAVTPEDGDDLVPGVRSNVFAQSLVLTRIMDYWGRTGGLSIVLPYAVIDTSAGPFRASTNGVSDVGFLWQMNIFGGPALTRAEFQSFIPQTFSSFHLLVTTPLGTYNSTSPINPSANRWMVSPTLNFSYTPDQGWSWIETYVSGRFFTDNNNYLVNGAQTQCNGRALAVAGRLLQPWRGDEHRRIWPGQHGEHLKDRRRLGHAPVARRRPWPQL